MRAAGKRCEMPETSGKALGSLNVAPLWAGGNFSNNNIIYNNDTNDGNNTNSTPPPLDNDRVPTPSRLSSPSRQTLLTNILTTGLADQNRLRICMYVYVYGCRQLTQLPTIGTSYLPSPQLDSCSSSRLVVCTEYQSTVSGPPKLRRHSHIPGF